ncbi:hypothetical protein V8C40DRAFT_243046 [Trichoderma camerunense]
MRILSRPTLSSALESLSANLQVGDAVSDYTVAQLCGHGRILVRTFGFSFHDLERSCFTRFDRVRKQARLLES